ncbi:hypothetical protein JNB63_05025 [Microbacterium trichothecenolyticum]|uniref:hypothetical protein n=1 Tax=Microbacterium trichothecenolyticum TaxID=69370 RepID=UPI001C6E70B3|nr:hypothetical protein [Microbacterium trichothecenolyticum]MBW9119450.1 hypothetical protein [Microbacterium trichothecenolyticum]
MVTDAIAHQPGARAVGVYAVAPPTDCFPIAVASWPSAAKYLRLAGVQRPAARRRHLGERLTAATDQPIAGDDEGTTKRAR